MSDLNEINNKANDTGVSKSDYESLVKTYSNISYESALDKLLKSRTESFKPEKIVLQCPKCQSVSVKQQAGNAKGLVCQLCNNTWRK
jgi:hypothetical protein